MMLLAIDPGISTGLSFWDRGYLVGCARRPPTAEDAKRVQVAVIEKPQVYQSRYSKGDPNDLITLAIRVGEYSERLTNLGVRVHLILPKEWKGQTTKEITRNRYNANQPLVAGARPLTSQECSHIEPFITRTGGHDVLDAVGIGLWWWTHKECHA